MILLMIKNTGIKQKLKKCIIGGTAALVLNSCATTNKFNRAYDQKEIPHAAVTSLNNILVAKQKPVDDNFLREQEDTLNAISAVSLSELKVDDGNHAKKETTVMQSLSSFCEQIKTECQRLASEYKRMENATIKRGKVSSLEILDVDTMIWPYRGKEVIETNERQITNQGINENVDIAVVRAAAQHRMHKFLDAATLALSGAEPKEVKALEKRELGYSVFNASNLFALNKLSTGDELSFSEKIGYVANYAIDDVIKYAAYEYRHDEQVKDPERLEMELEVLFDYMKQALNAYDYIGRENEVTNMKLLKQTKDRLIQILPEKMFGKPKLRTAMIDEIAILLSVEPLTNKIEKANFDLSKFALNSNQQQKGKDQSELTR